MDHLFSSEAGLVCDQAIGAIVTTKLNGDQVIKVEGKVEENHVESWPIKDNRHYLMKFRLSTYIYKVESSSILNVLEAA